MATSWCEVAVISQHTYFSSRLASEGTRCGQGGEKSFKVTIAVQQKGWGGFGCFFKYG